MNKFEKHLYILDGHALAYRSYYAMIKNPLTNAKGQPTGAVYAFVNYLLKLLEDYKCPYIAAVFDSPTPTFREKLYVEYKANRVEMPDDLKSQIPLILKSAELLGAPVVQKAGFEADDIIAYLTQEALKEDFFVSLVTRDKDLMQLVGEKVRMLAPETGGGFTTFGPNEVKAKMGVLPNQIRDLLALMGDASDNIPGVPGIGEKTAVKILEKAGDIDTLLKDPGIINNPKLADKIAEHKKDLEISRTLATLAVDIGETILVESFKASEPDKVACIEFFKELEFSSLLQNPLFELPKACLDFKIHCAENIKDVEQLIHKIKETGFVCIDTETTSTQPREAEIVGISMAIDTREALYVPLGHARGDNLALQPILQILQPFLEDSRIAKIGHNLKYDCQVFKNYDIHLNGLDFDTMVAAYLIDPGKRRLSLDALAGDWIDCKITPIEELIGKGKQQVSFAEVDIQKAAAYSGEDVILPLMLKKLFEPILQERKLSELFKTIEMPLVAVLAEMEWNGVTIDTDLLAMLSQRYTRDLEKISKDIYTLAGSEFNLNSPKQIAEVLFEKLNLPHSKKTKTGLSTDVDALEKLAAYHPVAENLLQYREKQKLLSTYIDALPQQISSKTSRLHSSFNQTITATGRLSSTNPNLQNIPIRTEEGRKIRAAFIAPPGSVLVSADYSQIELRLLAHLSQDALLKQAFLDDKDIHTQTAAVIYGDIAPELVTDQMRRAAKTINFGLMYGMGPVNLARTLNISFKEAAQFIEIYFAQFPRIKEYLGQSVERARAAGYSETIFGRRRYIPEINSENHQIRQTAERIAVNTPVQGSAADIIKIAMINIHADLHTLFPQAKMLLQVHDELVFEIDKKESEKFKEWAVLLMSGAYKMDVPLKVDAGIGIHWGDAH
ncbi:MAG: DNA polymerase I [Chitinivibrionales bacterium]|nr:DNA polymerase I [Chitinivibrionales bacterium]